MDFKGVTWAGDIYQKFEAMCLEVEEVMYQDTAKYVENQAQKVGASVKKFYSEVMQDLLPSSCVDPMKVVAGDLSLNPYAHTDLSKKPKSFFSDSPRELKKIKTEDEAISDTILPPLHSGVLVQSTSSELCSSKSKNFGVYRRPIGIKRISQLDRPSKVSSRTTSSFASCGVSGKASRDMNLKSPSDSVERCDPEPVNKCTSVSDAKIESSVSDKLLSAGSATARQKIDESECTSSLGTSANGTSISQKGLDVTTNACEIESVVEKVATSVEDTTIKHDSSLESTPDISSDTHNVEFVVEEVVPSNEEYFYHDRLENFDTEVIQNEELAEPRIEALEAFEGSNLEETCVLVEGDNLVFVSQGRTRKHKSYKKKIRDALSSKLRSRMKEGYNTHLVGGKNNPQDTIPALFMESDGNQNIMAHDSLESEWELL